MHLGPRHAQRLGDLGKCGLRHMAEGGLHLMEDRQKRPFHPLMRGDDLGDPRRNGGFIQHG